MLRSLFFFFLVLQIALSGSVSAENILCDRCKAMERATYTTPKPTKAKLICLYFKQEAPGPVRLELYSNGKLIRDPLEKKMGTEGKYCIGRQWVERATYIYVCNLYDERDTDESLKAHLLQHGEAHITFLR